MSKYEYGIYGIGLLAQLLFSARLLVQWFLSERAGKVLSPTPFWMLSLVASLLLMVYGALRNDLVIIGGQIISYFIYIRNLRMKGAWQQLPLVFRFLAVLFPVAATVWLFFGDTYSFEYIWAHNSISTALFAWGGAGQVIFTLRFVYQWYYSEQAKESVIPVGFWVISLLGGLMVMSYAVFRLDPVLFLGQIFGVTVYGRNLYMGLREGEARQASTH